MSTKFSQSFSNIRDRPLPEPSIRHVVAFEIGETAPVSENMELVTGAIDCARVEENVKFKLTREWVPGGYKALFSIPTRPCWEGRGRLCVDSPCVCKM